MIEKTVLNYYKSALAPVPVLMELPEVPSEDFPTMPTSFVIIQKVGGSARDHINTASIAFQSYSTESLLKAAELDEAVRNALPGILANNDIGGLKLASNYNFTDTRTKRYRYQCVVDFYF